MSLKRPAAVVAVFVSSAGALCALGVDVRIVCAAALAAASAFLLLQLFVFNARTGECLTAVFAAALSLAVALGFGTLSERAANLAADFDGTQTVIEGVVRYGPTVYENREVSVIKTEMGLVELTRYGPRLLRPETGDTVRLKVRLSAPSGPKNTNAFNDRTYLYSRKIFLTAVDEGELEIVKSGGLSPRALAGKIQSAAISAGEKLLRGDALGLYCAMVFGDRRHMSYELRQNLAAAGLSHIAAVSGLHLSVVAVIIMFLLSALFGRRRAGYAAAALCVAAFALVTGGSPSVTRACIMSVLYLCAKLIYREADSLNSLAAAVTVMLLVNPMLIYSLSFQLSSLATLGIILFMPLWQPKTAALPAPARTAVQTALVSISAQIGVLPVALEAFHALPTYFILSNLLIAPILTPVMAFGLLLPVFGFLPGIGKLLRALCGLLFNYIALVAGKIAALPKAYVPFGMPDVFIIIAYFAAVFALYMLCSGHKRASAAAVPVLLVFLTVGAVRASALNGRASLSFLNVGRGDCAVFCLPGGRTVMIDGGDDSYDAENFLLSMGRGRIDAAIVTSDKREHIGGLRELAEKGAISSLFIPSAIADSPSVRELDAPNVTFYDENTDIFVAGLSVHMTDYNDGAALLAEYGGKRIFFCSDGYTDWEACDIVKTPNHGSGKYNYINEINRAAPDDAVISGREGVDENCAYFPSLLSLGTRVHITGDSGTATFELDPQ